MRDRLKRKGIRELLRRTPGVRYVTHGSLRIATMACAPDELDDIRRVRAAALGRVEEAMRTMFAFHGDAPSIVLIALGAGFSEDERQTLRSRALRESLSHPGEGCWLRDLRIGVVRLTHNLFAERTILHEHVHALIDFMSDGFQFPYVLEEGFANAACEALLFDSPDWPNDGWKYDLTLGPPLRIDSDRFRPVRELICFELPGRAHEPAAMVDLSLALHRFLMRQSLARPVAGAVLRELRDAGISRGHEVYEWLASHYEGGAAELEESFRRFCSGKKSKD